MIDCAIYCHILLAYETKNRHHDLSQWALVVSGSLGRGAVARGGRLGQARGDLRQAAGRKHLPGSSSAGQPSALGTPASTDDVGIGGARCVERHSPNEGGGRSPTSQWLGVRPISGRTKKGAKG